MPGSSASKMGNEPSWLLQLAVVGGGTGGWMFFVLIQLWLTAACSEKKKQTKKQPTGRFGIVNAKQNGALMNNNCLN